MSASGLHKFVELFPDLIREASKSPLGVLSLIVLVISLVTMVLFRRAGGMTLIAFVLFLGSLLALAFRMMSVYPAVEQEHRERTVGPGRVELEAPAEWKDPIIRILGGTVITTNGNDLRLRADKELIVEGEAKIQSYDPQKSLPAPAAKPQTPHGADIPEAGQCQNGRVGNPGGDGELGATGSPGKPGGKIYISAEEATGSLTIIDCGMDGGPGGRGGDGGIGGTGQRGGRGKQNYAVPFRGVRIPTDCACGGAFGGPGGPGGNGGAGGVGGAGGNGGYVNLRIGRPNGLKVAVDVRGGLTGRPGQPGSPGEPGLGGLGGGGDGPACRDESNSRHGPNGTQRGNVPASPEIPSSRADSGKVDAGNLQVKIANN
ncbi:MAG: hypothetical protein QOH39_3384 [Verrucomicrobiota bacterium]